jgi:serine protease Do
MKRASVDAVAVCPKRDVSVGETAIAVGNPEGAGISATLGVVSVDSEHIVMSALNGTGAVASRVIRVDTAINSGNSGGGLYNASGELVGIVNAKIADSSVENIGYAIPASIAIPVAENVIYNCYGKENKSLLRPMIGVTLESRYPGSVIDESTGLITKTESVVIGDVSSGSLAEGRLAVGDVITSVKIGSVSASITRLHHVIDMMLNARLGDTVEITLLRAGVSQTVSIVITNAALTEY